MGVEDQHQFATAVEPSVRQAMASYRVPGIVVAGQCGSGPVFEIALGSDSADKRLQIDSLFPVASITKLATALTVLRLVADGQISLSDNVAAYLPDAAAAQPGVTIRRLLAHTAGLPLDLPTRLVTYGPSLDWPALVRACLETPVDHAPGTRVQYSNVGYGLLAVVVERQVNHDFPSILRRLVLERLGIDASFAGASPRPLAVVGGVRGLEAGTAYEPFNSAFWQSLGLPWAGLATSAAGALALVRAFRQPSAILPAAMGDDATSNQNDDLPGGFVPPLVWPTCWWGLGPDLRDQKSPHWTPPEASPQTFGHSGASGCCVWEDPTRDVRWAILGSRTADNGWILRAGPRIGTSIIDFFGRWS